MRIFKGQKKQLWDVRKVTEGGIMLGIVIALNIVFNFYITRIFPEGGAINVSLIFVIALVYRYGVWYGASINLLGTTIVYATLAPATMFPVFSLYSWWGIVISILLDYLGSAFIAIVISYYLNEKLFKNEHLSLAKGISFIVLRSIFGFTMSFVSGILVWSNYAAETGYGAYLYSFIFNITLSGGQCVVTIILFIPLQKRLPQFFAKKQLSKRNEKQSLSSKKESHNLNAINKD